MTRELQILLSKMKFKEFRQWYAIAKNVDLLPMFFNNRWLDEQKNPVYTTYKTMLVWTQKFPLPD